MALSAIRHTCRVLFCLILSNTWCTLQAQNDIPPKRAHHELIYDPIKKVVLLYGGSTPINEGNAFQFYNDLWHFDGKQWVRAGNAGDERSGVRMAFDSKRKQIYTYGGFLYDQTISPQLLVFEDPWGLTLRTDDPEMKAAEAGFVYDSDRDKLIAFGGSPQQGVMNNITWEWDGSSWNKFDGPGPSGRQAHIMVYDSKRKKTVLYGGTAGSGNVLDYGIWEFDGTKWSNIPNTAISPGQRISSGYAYDSKKGTLILFGGMSNKEMKGDTWSWDGSKWTKLADTGPAPRAMGYMAYDANRDRIVLFGGRLGWPNDANDTWEWDGKKWTEIKL